jgi:hypothetical protein
LSIGGETHRTKRHKTIILLLKKPGRAAGNDCSLLAAGCLLQLLRTQQNDRGFVALGGGSGSYQVRMGGEG